MDDVDHCFSSPKRAEVFGNQGIAVKTIINPDASNKVGLLLEVPEFATLKALHVSEEGAEDVKQDNVRPGTCTMLVESET